MTIGNTIETTHEDLATPAGERTGRLRNLASKRLFAAAVIALLASGSWGCMNSSQPVHEADCHDGGVGPADSSPPDSEPPDAEPPPDNASPEASAAVPSSARVGDTVTLDGSGSSDPDGDALTYTWSLVSSPPESTAAITESNESTAELVLDMEGDYQVQLTVSDGALSDSREVTITAIGAIHILDARILDAEYSSSLDRIVMVTDQPYELHIYDPTTGQSVAVGLPLAPTAVSVAPDGTTAAVGHNAWISVIDLMTGTLIDTHPVTTDVFDLVLAGNGFAYAIPRQGQWVRIHCVNIATGIETTSSGYSVRHGTRVKLHPTQAAIYGADNGLSPSDIEKYSIASGTAAYLYDSPYHGDYSMCGNLWISEDGLRIFTRCGNVFRSSENRATDMTYNGSLSQAGSITHLDHSIAAGRIAVISGNANTAIRLYDHEFLNYLGEEALPLFAAGGNEWTSHGRYVFFKSDGSEYYVIVQAAAASGLLHDFGVVRGLLVN